MLIATGGTEAEGGDVADGGVAARLPQIHPPQRLLLHPGIIEQCHRRESSRKNGEGHKFGQQRHEGGRTHPVGPVGGKDEDAVDAAEKHVLPGTATVRYLGERHPGQVV